MARPVSIKCDAVLDTARKIFMRHGLKATTAQVARAAGISEGSIFKHFKTKNRLFITAMHSEVQEFPWQKKLLASAGKGNIRESLEAAGCELLKRLEVVIPRMMMLFAGGMIADGTWCFDDVPPPRHNLRVLAAYFSAETKAGRLAVQDPEVLAHAVVGALAHYVFCEKLFGFRPSSPKVYVGTVVDMILGAAAPRAKKGGK